ncbi:acyltransferase [Gordonia jinhuaensis]|uniref:acyltransferase n=1 Tax=Gordonia jinhuaensis TaxID=1517702 RepID=UPI001E4766EE|nr:acyltransferase [Gordonia jinhuaensis]
MTQTTASPSSAHGDPADSVPPATTSVIRTSYEQTRRQKFVERFFNLLVTHVPSHMFRQAFLRFGGATIGTDTAIMLGANIIGQESLVIGDNVSIGPDVMLDARGGLTIDDDVVIAGDSQIITGRHLVNSPDFAAELAPVHIGHHAWLASRVTVTMGVTIGYGAVIGACSLVTKDVGDMRIAAGVPAKERGTRESSLDYHPTYRPIIT